MITIEDIYQQAKSLGLEKQRIENISEYRNIHDEVINLTVSTERNKRCYQQTRLVIVEPEVLAREYNEELNAH